MPKDMNPEMERPQGYDELINGECSWKECGIRIIWTEPVIPGEEPWPIGVPIRMRLCLEVKKCIPVHEITSWAWTPIITQCNPCGIWKEVKMHLCPVCTHVDDCGVASHIYETTIIPEKMDNFRLTFNVKWRNYLIWNNKYQKDNFVDVNQEPCTPNTTECGKTCGGKAVMPQPCITSPHGKQDYDEGLYYPNQLGKLPDPPMPNPFVGGVNSKPGSRANSRPGSRTSLKEQAPEPEVEAE